MRPMKIGMIGLGRMGANMARRIRRAGHDCVLYSRDPKDVEALSAELKAPAASSPGELAGMLSAPRIVWIMVPAAVVDEVVQSLRPHLAAGDIVIDGGNSYYEDDVSRARLLAADGIHYLDVGTSGGVWGLERGYCLMIGGEPAVVRSVEPIFQSLALGSPDAAGQSTAARGYLHVGGNGAGHFVKMVHNGIEYGLMAAFAEGFNLLHTVGAAAQPKAADAETAPLRGPQLHGYDFPLAEIAELWRHGSVVSSWLLDLLAGQLRDDPQLAHFAGRVADSGEGRWTVQAAIDTGVPASALAEALFARFTSRGNADFANRTLSALRLGFGGHHES
jgi:6-phosphogluconate dehydrogenase